MYFMCFVRVGVSNVSHMHVENGKIVLTHVDITYPLERFACFSRGKNEREEYEKKQYNNIIFIRNMSVSYTRSKNKSKYKKTPPFLPAEFE